MEGKEISPQFSALLNLENTFDVNTDPTYGNVEGSRVYAAEPPSPARTTAWSSLSCGAWATTTRSGTSCWTRSTGEADKDGILKSFAGAAYVTGAIPPSACPETEEYDGANGLKVKGADNGYDMSKSSSWLRPLMAATWNAGLLYEVGAASPGGPPERHQRLVLPCHQPAPFPSPAGCSSTTSEDPLLSSKLAARVISGAGTRACSAT